MESQQCLRQLTIVHTVRQNNCANNFLCSSRCYKFLGGCIIQAFCRTTQFRIKCKILYPIQQSGNSTAFCRNCGLPVYKFKQSFKHSRRRTRCRNKFQDITPIVQISAPTRKASLRKVFVHRRDTGSHRRRRVYFQIWESRAEALKLSFNDRFVYPFSFKLLKVCVI